MLKFMFLMSALTTMMFTFSECMVALSMLMMLFILCQSEMKLSIISILWEVDLISWVLMLLSVWITILVIMSSMKLDKLNLHKNGFLTLMMLLLMSLTYTFSVFNFLGFYFGFESSLLPVFLLVMGYGYQPERMQAGAYLVLYTIFGSFPLFMLIMMLTFSTGSSYMESHSMSVKSLMTLMMLLLAFLIKFPLYSSHLWLLKAHVEAPVGGSMVLAGVLLKLGGYGMMRLLPLWQGPVSAVADVLMMISIFGGMIMALICIRQIDIKLLIASSSVVHMSMCISSLLMMIDLGFKGAVIMMIAHGLCSSGLFFLASISTLVTNSRSLLVTKGLLIFNPIMSMWWFLMSSANMAAPPTINLLSEITLISSLLSWSLYAMPVLAFMSFLSAAYSLYLYSITQHGFNLAGKFSNKENFMLIYLNSILHWLPTNLLIICVCVFFS